MSDDSFPTAPYASHDFDAAREVPPPERDHGLDMPDDIDEPSTYDRELHYTPGGTIEQVVNTEIDNRARDNIRAAQARFRDGIGEDGQPLDVTQDRDDFEQRMMDRFNDANEREFDHDR